MNINLKRKCYMVAFLALLYFCNVNDIIASDQVISKFKSENEGYDLANILWREGDERNIAINEEYIKKASEQIKAILAYFSAKAGSECDWRGDGPNNEYNNLACVLTDALQLGDQCQKKHVGIIKKWFGKDIKENPNYWCNNVPYTATIQTTYDWILLASRDDDVKVLYKRSWTNLRERESEDVLGEDIFKIHSDKVEIVDAKTWDSNKVGQKIVVSPGKWGDYYHLKFILTPENTELTVSMKERRDKWGKNEYEFTPRGQFEVFVDKSVFPVSAPHFERKHLILRMPGTEPNSVNADEYIAQKKQLFENIKKMKLSGEGKVEVIVQLNPYMEVISKDPLRLELSGRNIFFRDAGGKYIDYLGPLRN